MRNVLTILLMVFIAVIAKSDAQGLEERNVELKRLMSTFNSVAGGFRKDATDLKRKQTVDKLEGLGLKSLAFAKKQDDAHALRALRQAVQTSNTRESLAYHALEMNRSHLPAGGNDTDFIAVVDYLKST